MFTDGPVTPRRVEIVVAVVREVGRRGGIRRDALYALLQPRELPDVKSTEQAMQAIRAALELELIEEAGQSVRPTSRILGREKPAPRESVIRAFDEFVLGSDAVEPYLALFYGYLLGLNEEGSAPRDAQHWADEFNRVVYGGNLTTNPFNRTKYRGVGRWLPYAGLGWNDPEGTFHCNPVGRLDRALPVIFDRTTRLDVEEFFAKLAAVCPELDGGALFLRANPSWDARRRQITMGLSHALLEMHGEDRLVLECPVDSNGWSLSLADPPRDGNHLRSDRVSVIAYQGNSGERR